MHSASCVINTTVRHGDSERTTNRNVNVPGCTARYSCVTLTQMRYSLCSRASLWLHICAKRLLFVSLCTIFDFFNSMRRNLRCEWACYLKTIIQFVFNCAVKTISLSETLHGICSNYIFRFINYLSPSLHAYITHTLTHTRTKQKLILVVSFL